MNGMNLDSHAIGDFTNRRRESISHHENFNEGQNVGLAFGEDHPSRPGPGGSGCISNFLG
jgi:hypothetical protein